MKLLAAAALALAGMLLAALYGGSRAQDEAARAPLLPLAATDIVDADARRIALGRALFHDRRLSRSMQMNCATCHDLNTNGASPNRIDRDDRGRPTRFNTPTVFNTRFSFRLGWEGRFRNLRELALDTLGTNHLMDGGSEAVQRLAADGIMSARFQAAYGAQPDAARIADALGAFLETLVTPAPFDRWLRGDKAALTPQQVRGYERFQALGCASCHQGRNIGANLSQRRGIFHPLGAARPAMLRVPSLRNVAVTSPYFHDGRVAKLPEAIQAMARAQLNLTISKQDTGDIAAFLESLTGSYEGRKLRQAERPKRPDRKR